MTRSCNRESGTIANDNGGRISGTWRAKQRDVTDVGRHVSGRAGVDDPLGGVGGVQSHRAEVVGKMLLIPPA